MRAVNAPSRATLAHLSDRLLYGTVERLVRLSHAIGTRSQSNARADDLVAARVAKLGELTNELSSRGVLSLRDTDTSGSSAIRLAPTGSSVNVAIIPRDAHGRALVLKFTDSPIAGAELAASSGIQEQLTSDPRLAAWSSYIPKVLADGLIGTTTYAIEQCLSSRDGRSMADDREATNALISEALEVIEDLHRISARRRRVDATLLSTIVDGPVDVLRANTSVGLFGCRARSIDRVARWLRQSLLGHELEVGWVHGDYHLGNVSIDEHDNHVIGVFDWGRAEPDGLSVLDGYTLIVIERSKCAGQEFSPFVIELLRDVERPLRDRAHPDVIEELRAIGARQPDVDMRCLLLLTWLKHVTNNLKNEERARSHGLWSLRTIDLALYGAAEIIGY